jgi:hypothetical protein
LKKCACSSGNLGAMFPRSPAVRYCASWHVLRWHKRIDAYRPCPQANNNPADNTAVLATTTARENKIVMQFGKKLALTACLVLAGCSAGREEEAHNLVTHFYQTHQSNRPSGALSLNDLITFRPFLSITLFDLLKDVSVAEEAQRAQTDNAGPALVDGDLFTTHPQGATSFHLLSCQIEQDSSNCAVEVIYSDTRVASSSKSVDQLVLTRDARGWVIDNIIYGGGNDKGLHQGDLQQNLQAMLKHNTRAVQ